MDGERELVGWRVEDEGWRWSVCVCEVVRVRVGGCVCRWVVEGVLGM